MEAYATHVDARLRQGVKPSDLIVEMMEELGDLGNEWLAAISISGGDSQADAIVRLAAKRLARQRLVGA